MKIFKAIRRHPIISTLVTLLLIIVIVLRLYLGVWLLDYVNNVLNNIDGYKGSVEAINIDLYRGAYRIQKLKLYTVEGDIPTPFINIETIDLAIQWKALLHGRIVSNIELVAPTINFAVSKSGKDEQTGGDTDWTKPIKALAPIDINRVAFNNGRIAYKDFSTTPKVDIYIHHMNGEITNLRNVEQGTRASLPSEVKLSGDSIGGGELKIHGHMNILKRVPDMDLDTKLENVDLRALNDYSNAYAAIDIRKGDLSIYSEFIVKNNHVSGYVKPIATHVALIDLSKSANPVKVAWESVASVILQIFTNLHKDQFATKTEFEGNLDDIKTNTWSTVGGILHNAFVSSLQKGLEGKP